MSSKIAFILVAVVFAGVSLASLPLPCGCVKKKSSEAINEIMDSIVHDGTFAFVKVTHILKDGDKTSSCTSTDEICDWELENTLRVIDRPPSDHVPPQSRPVVGIPYDGTPILPLSRKDRVYKLKVLQYLNGCVGPEHLCTMCVKTSAFSCGMNLDLHKEYILPIKLSGDNYINICSPVFEVESLSPEVLRYLYLRHRKCEKNDSCVFKEVAECMARNCGHESCDRAKQCVEAGCSECKGDWFSNHAVDLCLL